MTQPAPATNPLDWYNPPNREEILFGPDPRWFFEICCKIPTQDRGTVPFDLWPWMSNLSSSPITPNEIVLKSRDVGSSTFWIAEKLRKVITNEGRNLLIASEQQKSAVALLNYARVILKSLPDWCRPSIGNDNTEEIYLDKLNSRITALPGTPDSGRGLRSFYLICTEMAFWKDTQRYRAAVMNTLVPGGEVVIESTANGVGTMHHDYWTGAKSGQNGYRSHFLGVWENPNHTAEWYKQKRSEYGTEDKPDFLFFQEHPTTEEEAFQSSADNFFSADLINIGQSYIRLPSESADLAGPSGSRLGNVRTWRKPVTGRYYVAGVDVAEGKGEARDPDWSHAAIHDWRTGELACSIHSRQDDVEFTKVLYEYLVMYNHAYAAVERNGAGLSVLRQLESLGHRNFYYHIRKVGLEQEHGTKQPHLGWHTTTSTKPILLNNLLADLRSYSLTIYDWMFWDQTKLFDRMRLKSRHGHDDSVMAEAIANEARRTFHPGLMKDPMTPTERLVERTRGSWAHLFKPH